MADDAEQADAAATATPVDITAPIAPPKITTAAEWRAAVHRRWLLRLTSGVTVKARMADVPSLLVDGVISADELADLGKITHDPAALRARTDLARRVAAQVVVEPRIVLSDGEVPDDAIRASEVGASDALAILSWVLGNPGTVDVFPAEDASA